MQSTFRLNIPAVVVLAVLGLMIATVGATGLQQAKELSKEKKCQENLKELAIAFHDYHDVMQKLPPFTLNNQDGYGGWALMISPYLEDKTYDKFEVAEKADSTTNLPLVEGFRGAVWQCPTRRTEETYDFPGEWSTNVLGTTFKKSMPTDYVAAHTANSTMWSYQANGLIVNVRNSVKDKNSIYGATSLASAIDGTSNTALLGEKTHGQGLAG